MSEEKPESRRVLAESPRLPESRRVLAESPRLQEKRDLLDIAVALRYAGNGAPKVVAKGKGVIAEQIIAKAQENKIPMKADPGLASLLSSVPLGDEIPRELYVAVAEVLAFAYMLSEKNSRRE
ncbi:MAG: hypothetical protein EPN21_15480 [Methylococcaceae bacterium]|nr:MAG: hypothetical protein EPN21_15480 [Methylococcaceae bacterium]